MGQNNRLLILGAGEYGRVVREIAEDIGIFDQIDFLDDSSPLAKGRLEEIERFRIAYKNAAVALGNADLREKLIEKMKAVGYELPALISPRAYVSKSARIGSNVIIEPLSVVNAEAEVGTGTFICAGAIVNHNSQVGNYCTVQCGSVVPANSSMSSKTILHYNQVFDNRFSGPIDKRTPVGNGYRFEEGM